MAALFPFRALRPTPGAAARVAAVPYDVVSTDEARAMAADNPLSFLHVSRPEIDLPPGTDPYSDPVYAMGVSNYERIQREAPLVSEETPSLYVYRLVRGRDSQTGIAGCFSVDEYERDLIRKHERTRADKEDDRTRHILALRAQTGPVFLTYRASGEVNDLVDGVTATSPLFDFTAEDGVQHTVWMADPDRERALVDAFGGISALYIADGHHRAASAARARAQLRGSEGSAGEWDRFVAVAFPHDQVQILPYNRVVRDLGTDTPETFLAKLHERFTVRDGPAVPVRRGDVSVYLHHHWHTVSLGDPPRRLAPADRLDVSRLQDLVLEPLLGIKDVRTDPRIDFVGGGRGTQALEQQVLSGRAAVAFSMHPVSVEELMAISDAGGIMPPKSTWFEPKLRDGLLSHAI